MLVNNSSIPAWNCFYRKYEYIQAQLLAPDIVSLTVLICEALFSWLIASDAAAQKQNGHVIRGGPYKEGEKRAEKLTMCMFNRRQDVKLCFVVFTKFYASPLNNKQHHCFLTG